MCAVKFFESEMKKINTVKYRTFRCPCHIFRQINDHLSRCEDVSIKYQTEVVKSLPLKSQKSCLHENFLVNFAKFCKKIAKKLKLIVRVDRQFYFQHTLTP
jgi:hypothetical protein